MENLPKKPKRKKKAYVEPGSSAGWLMFVFAAVTGFGLYTYQPWENDWELVRNWLGQSRHHPIVGEWEIRKSVVTSPENAPIIADKGKLVFNDGGRVEINLEKDQNKTDAHGLYVVQGTRLAVNGLSSTGSNALPTNLKMQLTWDGPNALIATVNNGETLHLARHSRAAGLLTMLRLGVKKDKVEAPGEMKSVVESMRNNIGAEEGGN